MTIFQIIKHQIGLFTQESEVYRQPTIVDLEKDFDYYSFLKSHSQEQKTIEQLFQKVIVNQEQSVSVNSLLQNSTSKKNDLDLLKKMGFRQLSNHPDTGIVLEHEDFKGWLIKKNYGYSEEGMVISKAVIAKDFPWWMLPPKLQGKPKNSDIGFKVFNSEINPLRAAMSNRGQQWKERLQLDKIEVVKEYLYLLCDEETGASKKPLHERVVIISKKENILNETDNLKHFVKMAVHRPQQLKELIKQISLFIQHTFITDMHLHNIRFLVDGDIHDHENALDKATDRVIFIDGEPIGALSDCTRIQTINSIKSFDYGFFPLLGLKKLTASVREQMKDEKFPVEEIQRIQAIFDEVVNPIKEKIIRERRWHLIKTMLSRGCLIFIDFIHAIFLMLCNFYSMLLSSVLYPRELKNFSI